MKDENENENNNEENLQNNLPAPINNVKNSNYITNNYQEINKNARINKQGISNNNIENSELNYPNEEEIINLKNNNYYKPENI